MLKKTPKLKGSLWRLASCCAFAAIAVNVAQAKRSEPVDGPDATQRVVSARLDLHDTIGPMDMGQFSLAQGGLSPDPMWASRTAEVRSLRVRLIRVFVQSYFDLMPAPGRYDFSRLDKTVEMVRESGAEPLMDLTLKPKPLYPKIDPKIMDPTSWKAWEDFLVAMVRHYQNRHAGIEYWEIADECEIGEAGGTPQQCTPENYAVYYQHSVAAIRRADPRAKVGGPTVPFYKSPLIPYLLSYASEHKVPLDFISWHIYDNDPTEIRATMEYIKKVLARYPKVHPQTFLDEWNESLFQPPLDPRFQPCFIAEVAYQMKEAGIDYMGYYQIRDYHVIQEQFEKFMTHDGAMHMARWWNRQVQVDGLFDFQNTIRPSFFAFKMLSRLTGERLRFETGDPAVHGLAAWDSDLQLYDVLLWNFSKTPARLDLTVDGATTELKLTPRLLDATAASDDENVRMRPLHSTEFRAGTIHTQVELGPYGVELLTFAPKAYLNY